MQQLNFFEGEHNRPELPTDLLEYIPQLFTREESNYLLKKLIDEVPWSQTSVLMYGKEVLTPRLTAWFGDQNTDYSVAGTGSTPYPWTEDLLFVRKKVEEASDILFNSVLLNYYRNGNDSVSWHDDEDRIPGRNKYVASVSFGEERLFDFRKKSDHNIKYSLLLENGSCILMKGDFQKDWQHRIAKSKQAVNPRINLTFRQSRVVK